MRSAACHRSTAAWLAGGLLALAAGAAVAPTARAADAPAASAGPAASAAATHRPLRSHREPAAPTPTDPQVFDGITGAPAYAVVPRKSQLQLYRCSQCHKVLPLNPQPRKLVAAPHQASLDHGGGRMWCLDCHFPTDRDVLRTVNGAKVDFDASDRVCGQCHGNRHRDWAYGGHGKRVAGWQGERRIYACTHCHDPHTPALAPRAPGKPPPVRAGLQPMRPVAHGSTAAAAAGASDVQPTRP